MKPLISPFPPLYLLFNIFVFDNVLLAQQIPPASSSGTILDNINNLQELGGVSLALRTFCGLNATEILSSPNMTVTFFAPIDSALNQTFDISRVQSAGDFGCLPPLFTLQKSLASNSSTSIIQQDGSCQAGIFASRNLSQIPFVEISQCFPELFSYHIVPSVNNSIINIPPFSSSNNSSNSSIIPLGSMNQTNFDGKDAIFETMLNSTQLVQLGNNSSQVIALHQSNDGGVDILHGAWPPARVVNSTTGTNGIVYLIDQVLTPPVSLFNTLSRLNMTMMMQEIIRSNQTSLNLQPRVTIFAIPDSGLNSIGIGSSNNTNNGNSSISQQQSSLFNVSSYAVLDQVFYVNTSTAFIGNSTLNGSSNSIANGNGTMLLPPLGGEAMGNPNNSSAINMTLASLQAMDGTILNISIDSTGTIRVNNSTIVQPNILTRNGVVHLLDGPFIMSPPSSTNSTFSIGGGGGEGNGGGNTSNNNTNTILPFRGFWRKGGNCAGRHGCL